MADLAVRMGGGGGPGMAHDVYIRLAVSAAHKKLRCSRGRCMSSIAESVVQRAFGTGTSGRISWFAAAVEEETPICIEVKCVAQCQIGGGCSAISIACRRMSPHLWMRVATCRRFHLSKRSQNGSSAALCRAFQRTRDGWGGGSGEVEELVVLSPRRVAGT